MTYFLFSAHYLNTRNYISEVIFKIKYNNNFKLTFCENVVTTERIHMNNFHDTHKYSNTANQKCCHEL